MQADVYHLVTINDGKSDSAAILKVFRDIAEGRLKSDVRLLNYCQELPVSYPCTVNAVERDSVELSIHEHQALIMMHDNSTLIKSRHFEKDLGVHCYAAYVNTRNKIAILHNFAYAQIRADRREAVRVTVNGTVPVKFSFDNVIVEGSMINISGTGVSCSASVLPAMEPDQEGTLFFSLNGSALSVPGSFVRVIAGPDGRQICIFQMTPDAQSDAVIGKYIFQRQVEIIHELKEGMVHR